MRLYSPDRYRGQPGKWIKNEASRAFLGVLFTVAAVIVYFLQVEEYPSRLWLGLALVIGYLLYELITQAREDGSKDWLDVAEDTVWWGYGVSFVLYPLHEVERYSPTLMPDFPAYGEVIGLIVSNALVGVVIRLWQRCRRFRGG